MNSDPITSSRITFRWMGPGALALFISLGSIGPGESLTIWAMTEDISQVGFNCGFGTNIWNNSKSDPALLFDATNHLIDRYP